MFHALGQFNVVGESLYGKSCNVNYFTPEISCVCVKSSQQMSSLRQAKP